MLTPLKVKASGMLKQQIQIQQGHSNTSGPWWREEDRMVRWQDLNILGWMGGWNWMEMMDQKDGFYYFTSFSLCRCNIQLWCMWNEWDWVHLKISGSDIVLPVSTLLSRVCLGKLGFHRFSDLFKTERFTHWYPHCAPLIKSFPTDVSNLKFQ